MQLATMMMLRLQPSQPGWGTLEPHNRIGQAPVSTQPWVLIGLGSNQGESSKILQAATLSLRGMAAGEFRVSRVWRTSPVDCPPGSPDFLNAAIALQPHAALTPEHLLRRLKYFERVHGRSQTYERNAPRPLDLDLLLFGSAVRGSAWFQLPHPRAVDRRFVLVPAAEVLPNVIWPGTNKTIARWLAEVSTAERLELACQSLC